MCIEDVHWSSIFQLLKSEVYRHMTQQSHAELVPRKSRGSEGCVHLSPVALFPTARCGSHLNVHGQHVWIKAWCICMSGGDITQPIKGTKLIHCRDVDEP